MDAPANYIVTQCYGNEGIFMECAYALLSLSRLYNGTVPTHIEVWIYTDKPEWFARFADCPFPLHFCHLSPPLLQQWRGAHGFVHRVKIAALIDFTNTHQGNVLYVDTDVVFTHPIDKIWTDLNNGELYMHVQEAIVSSRPNPILAKLDDYLHKNSTPPLWDMAMWNAGVLGFNTRHAPLLARVLAYTDATYPAFPKHIVEQFAFSVCFAQVQPIKSAAPYLLHYWNLKEARTALAAFFNHFQGQPWALLVRYGALLQMHVLIQDKVNFLANRSITGKLMKKKWQPAATDWQALVSQA